MVEQRLKAFHSVTAQMKQGVVNRVNVCGKAKAELVNLWFRLQWLFDLQMCSAKTKDLFFLWISSYS